MTFAPPSPTQYSGCLSFSLFFTGTGTDRPQIVYADLLQPIHYARGSDLCDRSASAAARDLSTKHFNKQPHDYISARPSPFLLLSMCFSDLFRPSHAYVPTRRVRVLFLLFFFFSLVVVVVVGIVATRGPDNKFSRLLGPLFISRFVVRCTCIRVKDRV